jgi:hypothetical protein
LPYWRTVAGAQPESLLEVPIHRLRDVANPACTAAFSAGRCGHHPSAPSNLPDPQLRLGWLPK